MLHHCLLNTLTTEGIFNVTSFIMKCGLNATLKMQRPHGEMNTLELILDVSILLIFVFSFYDVVCI